MANQISAETISPIAYQNLPVITTELLAQLYGTEVIRIQQNHKRNDGRFVEGKHFFKVVGDGLKNLRLSLSESQNSVSPKTRSLILWTERGAARHAKMLETDQAWEVFEKLEDCYFNQKDAHPVCTDPIHGSPRTMVIRFDENGNIAFTEQVPHDAIVATLDRVTWWLERNGWLVIRQDQLKSLTLEQLITGKIGNA